MFESADALVQQVNLDLDGMLHRLGDLLDAAWGPGWGRFTEKEPGGTDPAQVDLPVITYRLTQRRASKSKQGIKPRIFESQPDPEYPGYAVEIHRQWFDCDVAFRTYHATHEGAKDLADRLDRMMLAFIGYFKELGISEIVWQSETAPDNSVGGLKLPHRVLTYLIRIERVLLVRRKYIEEIVATVQTAGGGDPDQPLRVTIS